MMTQSQQFDENNTLDPDPSELSIADQYLLIIQTFFTDYFPF